MPRNKGDTEYKEEAESIVLSLLSDKPITRSALTNKLNELPKYHNIHYYTVGRILKRLEAKNKAKEISMGRIKIWVRA